MPVSRASLYALLSFLFCVSFAPPAARAQIANVDDTTSTPTPGVGHDYIQMLSETVNPASGTVSLRIQLPTPKGRGITLPFSIDYDSGSVNHLYSPTIITALWAPNNGTMLQGGWSYGYPSANFGATQQTEYNGNNTQFTCDISSNYVFRDPSGGLHPLGLWTDSPEANANGSQCNWDGGPFPSGSGDPQFGAYFPAWTGESFNPPPPPGPFLVTSPDGTVYHFNSPGYNAAASPPAPEDAYPPDTITDRNGNTIKSTSGGSGSGFTFSFTDTIGRTLISSNGFGPSGTTNTLIVGGLTYYVTWKTTNPNYTTLSTPPPDVGSNYCASIPANTQSQTVIQSIALPNGKSFTFYYGTDSTPHGAPTNPYGLLSEIDYPTGAWVQYTWNFVGMNELAGWTAGWWHQLPNSGDTEGYYTPGQPDSCLSQYNTPVVTQRKVSYNGSSVALTQNFTYTTNWQTPLNWNTKTTTVTDADGVTGKSTSTLYNYSNFNTNSFPTETPVESSISYFDSQSNLLRTVTKGWEDTYHLYCEVDTDYQYPNYGQGSGQSSGTWYLYGPGYLLADKREYDFGLVTPAACTSWQNGTMPSLPSVAPTRETVTNYPQTFPGTHAGGTIVTIPSSVQVYAGGQQNGTLMAETDYQYDGGTPSVGNLTMAKKLCLQSGSACSQGNSVTTTYTYNAPVGQYGLADSKTDALGNVTHFTYTDSYNCPGGAGLPTSPTYAYLTQVTYPQTNGVSHVASYCYNYTNGLLFASTGENGTPDTTSYLYTDTLNRLTNVTYPSGGGTETYSYSDSVPSITHTRSINGSSFSHSDTTTFDGAGHTIQTKTLAQTSSGGSDLSCGSQSVYVYTTYDGEGRPYTVSNPNCGSGVSSPTDGTTTYAYDPLDRTTSVTEPDGSVVTFVYSIGTDILGYPRTTTLVTDEALNQRESLTDGLGRLIQVEEPDPAIPAQPGTGSATASGTEQSTVTSASPGTGTVTISGGESDYQYYNGSQTVTVWDAGTITVTINGKTANAYWGEYSTASTLASSLASAINSSMSSFVRASATGGTVTITATGTGVSTDYTLSTSSATNYPQYFGSGSFHSQASGSTLIGGESAGTTYDTGTVSLTANGHTTSHSYG